MNTIAELISSRASDEQTALLFDEQRWSYREFVEDCAQRAAYLLDARDQSKPFHIAVLLDNVPEYPLWLGACALAGATLVGLNPTRRGADMERDISHTECARRQLPWPVDVNYSGRWKRGMRGSAFRL